MRSFSFQFATEYTAARLERPSFSQRIARLKQDVTSVPKLNNAKTVTFGRRVDAGRSYQACNRSWSLSLPAGFLPFAG